MSQRFYVAAGASKYTIPETITYTGDISTATVKLSIAPLGTTPTVWVTPTEDASGDVKKRTVKMKIDGTVPGGVYWLWYQITTTGAQSEIQPDRLALLIVESTVVSAGSTSAFHVVDNHDGTETLVYG